MPRFEKIVLLARRSARKRNRFARSLGGEGNRIDHTFRWEGNKNTRRCRWKGIESSSYCIVNYIEKIITDFFPEIKKDIIDIPIICNSFPFPLHQRVFLFPSHPKLRTILFPSPPKLRIILFLFHADLRARSTTFSRKWLKSFNWEVNLKNYQRGKT